MKRFVALLVFVMVLVCGWALADEFEWPPKDSLLANLDYFAKVSVDHMGINAPEGVVYSNLTKAAGSLAASVSAVDTKWSSVMVHGTYPDVLVNPYVTRPSEKYDTCHSFNGGFDTSIDSFFNFFANTLSREYAWSDNRTSHTNGAVIGTIVADQCLFLPRKGGDGSRADSGFCIMWMDRDLYEQRYPNGHRFTAEELKALHAAGDEMFYFEYILLDIGMDTDETFYVPYRSLSAAAMAPTHTATMPSGVSVKSIVNGDITYSLSNLTTNVDAPLVLKAPANAKKLWVFSPYSDNSKYDEENYFTVSNGTAIYYHQMHWHSTVEEHLLTAVWLDADNKILDYGTFWIHTEVPGYLPGPCYIKNTEITLKNGSPKIITWTPVDSDRVRIDNACEGLGVKTTYTQETGVYHISYDEVEEVTGTVGKIKLSVKAPAIEVSEDEGVEESEEEVLCTYARWNGGGGNNIMGPDSLLAQENHETITQQSYAQELYIDKDGYIELADHEPLRQYNAGPIEVYIQSEAVWPYGGGHRVIYWYKDKAAFEDDPENPYLIEYVVNTAGTICVTTRTEIVEDEDDIKDTPVDNVTCISPELSGQDWHLVIRRYPQKGSNAFHWELYLENECGDYVPLQSNATFYLPYPEGHYYDAENDCARDKPGHTFTYEIYHYNIDYDSYESVQAKATEYGIKFVTRSLSPFVLDWGDYQGSMVGTPTPEPEETPDPEEPEITPTPEPVDPEEPEPTPDPEYPEEPEHTEIPEPTPDPEHPEDPDQPGQGGNDQQEHFNLRELDLWNGKSNVRGGRYRNVIVSNKATVSIKKAQILGLCMRFYDQGNGDGVSIEKGTSIKELFLEFGQEYPSQIKSPYIVIDEEAAVTELRFEASEDCNTVPQTDTLVQFQGNAAPIRLVIMMDLSLFNPNWIEGAKYESILIDIPPQPGEEGSEPMEFFSYEQFLIYYNANH